MTDYEENKSINKPFTLFNNETGQSIEIPILSGTEGPNVLDIRLLYKETGMFTYDNNLAFLDFDMAKKLFLSNKNKIYFEVELNDIDKVDVFKKEIFESQAAPVTYTFSSPDHLSPSAFINFFIPNAAEHP